MNLRSFLFPKPVRRSTIEAHRKFSEAPMPPLTLLEQQSRFGDKPVISQVVCPQNGTTFLKGLRYNAEFGGDANMNTTDATRISYVYVRIMPNNVEHKLHNHPSTGAR